MVKFILIKSPDEWATTKQACRDELVVYLFFSSIYILLYFHVLSTVLRTSSLHFIHAPRWPCRALYDNSQWKNSTSATQPRIFLYHHEATTFNDSSKRPSSFYGEYAGRPTSFSIPTRPRLQRKLTASNQPKIHLPSKN